MLLNPSITRLIIGLMAGAFFFAESRILHAEDGYLLEGYSQPNRVSEVAAAASGIVSRLLVDPGTAVRAGECVCELDNAVHEKIKMVAAAARDSLGEISAATAELNDARLRRDTVRGLAERKHSYADELRRIESAFELSEARLQIAQESRAMKQAEYEKLVTQSEDYCVRAPFDGVITEFYKEIGEYVGPGTPSVCKVAELKTLSVDFLVPRVYRHQFQTEQKVAIAFTESDRRVTGSIYYISPYPDGETNTYNLRVRVDNTSGHLSAGERCQIDTAAMAASTTSAAPKKYTAHGK